MRKWHRVALAATLTAVTVGGLGFASATANAQTNEPTAVAANKRVVQAFMDDVLNGHHGDHAALYLTEDMSWHGGTVGTVSGRDNVAGLMTLVVTSIPDLHASVQDIFGQGDEVV